MVASVLSPHSSEWRRGEGEACAMRQPVQRKASTRSLARRASSAVFTSIEWAASRRPATHPPPMGGIVVEIAMPRVRARGIVIFDTIDRRERPVTYPRQHCEEVGHRRPPP